jgi:hypothetical protein
VVGDGEQDLVGSHAQNGVRSFELALHSGSGPSPQPTNARRARGEEFRANGVSRAGPAPAGSTGYKRSAFLGSELTDFDIIAREVSGYRTRFEAIEKRLDEIEKVNARLEEAALTTARVLAEIAGHWNAVHEAMRRKDESQEAAE